MHPSKCLHGTANPTELNPSSGNELCHSWDRKPKLDFATSLFCSFWKRIRESQMPKLGKADLGMTELLDNLILRLQIQIGILTTPRV